MKTYLALVLVLSQLVGCGTEPEPTRRTHQVTLKLSGSVESIRVKAFNWRESRQVSLPWEESFTRESDFKVSFDAYPQEGSTVECEIWVDDELEYSKKVTVGSDSVIFRCVCELPCR